MSREVLEEITSLFSGVKYDFNSGPLIERAEHIFEVGLNCQLLAHIALEELGYGLPKDMRSKELYEDTDFTFPIDPEVDGWRPGDILFTYQRPDNFDPKFLHMSVCIAVEAGAPHFLHALKFKDSERDAVTVWQLEDFERSNVHEHIISAKRVR
ncbi:MAG: hypothetical protein GW762_00135 [Candidatus Pacebacteria bacterium]|nr:hypothetical protein [Candidatus Paceibacterota bacterium]PIR63974.1 MAG: hypothetical protein COU64_01575 [Candidatus Pacebacteria bacterium CG10_big_fil_rev_8_21_14_0_10_40_26]PIZ79100.1 MAG: hypothetical protein COY01_01590 [Candidatus Pacebacteria bacterium CG_4_10_14_0_2_um_filter_40_20]PJA69212.1 MAG: hypothetical protein CO156_01245 [Candidatus Pacebacteria bacterium CG_4_9_14_3_um_filter_40_12]PJC42066.1 MAG: hypothetical protein CO041_00300 [Candidatus Pacebacteria bacterium CG_4_9_